MHRYKSLATMPEHTKRWWPEKRYSRLQAAQSYTGALGIALEVLEAMPDDMLAIISGPITSGGRGRISANLQLMAELVDVLAEKRFNVFNYLPFQRKLRKLYLASRASGLSKKEADNKLMNEFFHGIYHSGLIKHVFSIPGWRTSNGARKEHEWAEHSRISTFTLDSILDEYISSSWQRNQHIKVIKSPGPPQISTL